MTFKEASIRWFEDYAYQFQKKTTYTRNEQLTRRVYQRFGETEISSITRSDIQTFMNDLNKEGVSERNGNALAFKTRKHYLTYLSDVFKFCVEEEFLKENPCRNIRVAPDTFDESKEDDQISLKEAKELLNLIDTEAPLKYRCFFFLVFSSGMRRSEMMGLEWRDIDFDSGLIKINRVSNYTSATGRYTDSTKTKGSKRCVVVPSYMIEILKEYRNINPFDRVFVQDSGEPMHSNTPYTWLERFCKTHGLKFLGIHKFRHLYASILINAGLDVATVSKCLGHSQISTTLNIYAHAFDEAYIKGCKAITSALEKVLK